jgi:iron complex transport system permease protein
MKRPGKSLLLLLIFLVALVSGINLTIGSSDVSAITTLKIILYSLAGKIGEIAGTGTWITHTWEDKYDSVILLYRLPRVLLGILVGAALATAGCSMQGLLKNPMADPYIIGMSAGASLGAAIAIILQVPVQILSFGVAALSILVVYNISKIGEKVPTETLLLAGVAVGFFLSAITTFLLFVADAHNLKLIIYWMMGSLATSTWFEVQITFVMVAAGILMLYRQSWNLNVMLLGEEQAHCMGVDIEKVKKHTLVFSSLVTAAAVSVSGVIGFVGLIIPHIMRILVGPDHRILLPASTLTGAIFLVLSDSIVKIIGTENPIPVGVITAFFGVPFFIYLLRKRREGISA